MQEVVSEDAVRRALEKIDELAGLAWMQEHLNYCTRALLSEPWVLDVDTTVKPLYGHQEGAAVSYNPHKPGRPSHSYHTYLLGNLRLVLAVEVASGNQHTSRHSAPGLWELLNGLASEHKPALIPGDVNFGNEPVMREAEQRGPSGRRSTNQARRPHRRHHHQRPRQSSARATGAYAHRRVYSLTREVRFKDIEVAVQAVRYTI
jgi:hypothetical protein